MGKPIIYTFGMCLPKAKGGTWLWSDLGCERLQQLQQGNNLPWVYFLIEVLSIATKHVAIAKYRMLIAEALRFSSCNAFSKLVARVTLSHQTKIVKSQID